MILAGLAANLIVPLVFLAMMVPFLRVWHNPDEAAIVLVGLALVSSMPIAGSSTGWRRRRTATWRSASGSCWARRF